MNMPLLEWTGPATQARTILEKHRTGTASVKETLSVLDKSGAPTTAEVHGTEATVTSLQHRPQARDKAYVLDTLSTLFGEFKGKIDFVPGAIHPKYSGAFHPDDYSAF